MDLETLAVRAELQELTHLYAHAADRRRWHLMEHVFHEDGRVGMSLTSGPWREWAATAAEVFERNLGDTAHVNSNFLAHIDGDLAHTETYCTAYHRVLATAPPGGLFGGTGEEYDLIGGLRYVDRFERRDGRWAIAERRVQSDWRHVRPAADGRLSAVPPEYRGGHADEPASLPLLRRWQD